MKRVELKQGQVLQQAILAAIAISLEYHGKKVSDISMDSSLEEIGLQGEDIVTTFIDCLRSNLGVELRPKKDYTKVSCIYAALDKMTAIAA